MKTRQSVVRSKSALLLAFLSCTGMAHAEITSDTLLGPAIRLRPAYDGSGDTHLEAVPIIRYLGAPFFIRSTQGIGEAGVRIEPTEGLHVGAQLAYEFGRNPKESDLLKFRGIPGINRGMSYGLQLEWDHKLFGLLPINALGRVRKQTDSDRGTQGDIRFTSAALKLKSFGMAVFVQGTWADAKATNSAYGISGPISVASGLPAYLPGSGWLFSSVGLHMGLELSPEWLVIGNVESRHFLGDARNSPLVQKANSNYFSAGIAYRFK